MIEQYLKSLSDEYKFPFNHLNKILSVDLDPPFTVQLKDDLLKFFGSLPPIQEEKKEQGLLKLMQLNLALQSCESLCIGQMGNEGLTLSAEICYTLDYKMLKEFIESFANHLDKISSMIQDLNKEN